MIDDIALFIKIVECNSLAAAARHLNIPTPTVTRRLKKLEDNLGCQLLHRNARKLTLTADGETYYQAYGPLMVQLEEITRSLSDQKDQMKGPLIVQAPTNISLGFLRPMWTEFVKKYPDIELDLRLNNAIEDMASSKSDIALRAGPQADSSLFQKKLGAISTLLVAAPAYLVEYGPPHDLRDLADHRLIMTKNLPTWVLHHRDTNEERELILKATTHLNDVTLASHMAIAGRGIALLPLSEVSSALKTGQLRRILPNWSGPIRNLYAVWPSGRLLNAKAKSLREFMESYIPKALKAD
ncbi:LysR family transcriptional regulator [Terasakiella sp. A23]|uniref:LysR family transcriptional regulator n=1 Tax=Terasakiella sp. FCG-A23 TaxID=3080561 RepID=UPI002954A070|nr:LysR family transcriptional regulator [Terasakiella sp. A23]MDV7340139.1 LysR family transcriptional regulator [Terasakiella sp. A23]